MGLKRRRLVSKAFAFNTAGIATGTPICTVSAGGVVLSAWVEVLTAFNAVTTNVVTIGVTGTVGKYIGTADVTEGTPGVWPATPKGPFAAETAQVTVQAFYTQTGTAATTGSAVAYVEFVG